MKINDPHNCKKNHKTEKAKQQNALKLNLK